MRKAKYGQESRRPSSSEGDKLGGKGVEHTEEHLNYYWDFEAIPNLDAAIDWEQRRYELAKSAIIDILASPIVEGIDPNPSVTEVVHHSVVIADAIIKELKGE